MLITEVIEIDPRSPQADRIAHAAERLRDGGLVAFPTETVYGLGVNALDRAAVRRLFDAKGRPATDPLIVHVASIEAAGRLTGGIPEEFRTLAMRFWPGPLTFVVRRSERVPDEVTASLDTVAIRMPAHPIARALIAAAEVPVAAPSANLFSRPSPTRAAHVLADLDGRIDIVIEGGPTTVGVESTVLDLSSSVPTILRPGAVSLEMLRALLPHVRELKQATGAAAGAMPSPGLLEKHYSPRTPLTLYEGPQALAMLRRDADAAIAEGQRVALLIAPGDLGEPPTLTTRAEQLVVREIGPESAAVAAALYATLRELDARGVDRILVREFFRDDGLGVAIADRLRRAAAGRIVRS